MNLKDDVQVYLDSDDDVVLSAGGGSTYLLPADARRLADALILAANSAQLHRDFMAPEDSE